MLGKLLKVIAYKRAPAATFTVLHPIETAQWVKVPWDLRYAYAPRLTALLTALLVAPLAFRLGKRAAEGTLFYPSSRPDHLGHEEAPS
jgi:hypothetical protein